MVSLVRRVLLLSVICVMVSASFAFSKEGGCVKVQEVKLSASPEYAYLKEGMRQAVVARLGEKGAVVLSECTDAELSVDVTLFGGSAVVSMALAGDGGLRQSLSKTAPEKELLGVVVSMADEVASRLSLKKPTARAEAPEKEASALEPRFSMRTKPVEMMANTVAVGDMDGDGALDAKGIRSHHQGRGL